MHLYSPGQVLSIPLCVFVCVCDCVCVCVCVCARTHMLVCAYACPSTRPLAITSTMMWHDMDFIQLVKHVLQLLYHCYIGIALTHHRNQPNSTKVYGSV